MSARRSVLVAPALGLALDGGAATAIGAALARGTIRRRSSAALATAKAALAPRTLRTAEAAFAAWPSIAVAIPEAATIPAAESTVASATLGERPTLALAFAVTLSARLFAALFRLEQRAV